MKKAFFLIVVTVVVVALSSARCAGLHRPLDEWDERGEVLRTLEIDGFSGAVERFWNPQWVYYRPLGIMSYKIDQLLSGRPNSGTIEELTAPETAFQYRLTNLVWHVIGALCFGLMLCSVTRWPLVGSIGAILYAAGPSTFLVSDWAASRYDMISAAMIMLTVAGLFCHLRTEGKRSRWWLAGSIVTMVLGLTAKENTLVTPAFLSVAVILLSGQQGWNWKKAAPGLAILWALALAYLLARHFLLPQFMDPATQAMIHTEKFWRFVARLYFAPIEWLIATARAYAGSDAWILLNTGFWQDIAKLAAVTASTVIFRRHWRMVATFWAWVLVMYVPVALNHAFNSFTHYPVLPSTGYSAMLALMWACWLGWLYERWPIWQPRLAQWATPRLTRPARAPSR